jgi:hypothetical protein
MNEITVPARSHSHGAAKAKKGSKSRNGAVKSTKVNLGVWQTALKYADGKVERIDIISPVKVEVWLSPAAIRSR